MSASISREGIIRQLDKRTEPDANITEDDVQKPAFLVRTLLGILRDLATLKRRFLPKRLYRDFVLDDTGTTKYRVQHDFRGLPYLFVVRWRNAAGPGPADVQIHPDSDARTLVFVSYAAGRATVCLEEAGS